MFIRTPRLLLRPGWPEDAPALYAAIAHIAVATNLSRLPWPYGLDDAVAWLKHKVAEDEANFVILERGERATMLAGGIGLRRDAASGAHELGYWLAPSHQGRGIATEAGHAVIAMARDSLRLPRLVAAHFADNPVSGRVLAKLGFVATGIVEERMPPARAKPAPAILYEAALEPVRLAA